MVSFYSVIGFVNSAENIFKTTPPFCAYNSMGCREHTGERTSGLHTYFRDFAPVFEI